MINQEESNGQRDQNRQVTWTHVSFSKKKGIPGHPYWFGFSSDWYS